MTRLYGRAIVVAALLCASLTCSNIDNIDVVTSGRTTVPQRSLIEELIGPISFTGFGSFDISQSQEFRNQGYTKDQIDSVKLTRITLAIANPSGSNFDFIESIRFFAESDGLPRIEIAASDPVARGASTLELDLAGAELADYAAAESMTISTEATGNRPAEETTIDAEVVLDVDVSVSGAIGCRVAP